MTHFNETATALQALDQGQLDRLLGLVRDCQGTVWICGNGGSMSTAQHWACDLSKAAGRRAQALGSNPAILTAWANDVSYSTVLSEELRRVAQSNDALVCLSCSGRSQNITGVLLTAKHMGVKRALITGDTRPTMNWLDVLVQVPSSDYGVIEDCHLAIGHWLTKELRCDK